MGLVHQKYKVAVVQAAPVFLDLDATIAKTNALIEEASAKGAKLIAFPETFIPGYPWQIWLGAPAWAIGRGFVQRYFDNSLALNSPEAEKIRNAVKRAKLTAVLGLSERDGGSLYIAQWLIGSDGETIAKRRNCARPMPSAPCSAKATVATSRCMIAPTSGGSARCAAGSTCSR
jgi:aliphatic nitrilase